MAFRPPDPFGQAIRQGVSLTYSVSASTSAGPIAAAQNMAPTGGSIDDDAGRDWRRNLSLDLAPAPGLFDLLKPTGATLTATCTVTYLNTRIATLPMGVFDIDTENSGEVDGALSISAPDKWVRVKRARFLRPQASNPSLTIPQQIASLIRGALGSSEPVVITSTSTTKVGPVLWERDRDKAIMELATSIGAWVFFDRYGVATVADRPVLGYSSDWTVDAGMRGVLTSLDRSRSRERTFNVVVASSSKSDGGDLITPQMVWDSDPLSPTYAGTNPYTGAGAGPFGIVPYFFESPLINNVEQAKKAARTTLATTVGLASQVSLGMVPNPAIDAMDVLDVVGPMERFDIPRAVERHMVDKVTHSFDPKTATRIEGRSTRADEFT